MKQFIELHTNDGKTSLCLNVNYIMAVTKVSNGGAILHLTFDVLNSKDQQLRVTETYDEVVKVLM